jgi:uncharacterized protein YbjT (DUF2867 family)
MNQLPSIAVVGATGLQGGGVVRALEAGRRFRVRALTRNPEKHRGLAAEVVAADLDRPDTLRVAFAAAHGVFLVTNFWEEGTAETFAYFQAHAYLGVESSGRIALADEVAGHPPTSFANWVRVNRPAQASTYANWH